MSRDKDYHVVPNPNVSWDVKRGGADKASNHYDTKQPEMDRARDLARKSGEGALSTERIVDVRSYLHSGLG